MPPILDMEVAGQHNNVGADNWRHEIAVTVRKKEGRVHFATGPVI